MKTLTELHIVIAEDDQDDTDIILESFSRHSAFTEVKSVKNGEELITYLKHHRSHLPNIILTDINMPIKDGIEALTDISEDDEFCNIPVVIYSSTFNPTYEQKCKKLGSVGYLIKPYTLSEFDNIPSQLVSVLREIPDKKGTANINSPG